jgi:site-specific recombinase XerD
MGRAATGTVDWRRVDGVEGWHARVTVRTDNPLRPKRRVWVDLERPDLKNNPADKATAKRLAARHAKVARKGTHVGVEQSTSSRQTLVDLEERWHALLERNPDLATKTVARYKQSWTQLVEAFGKLPVGELTPLRIREWIWKRRDERSVSTVLNDCNALSRFFQDAIREKWIAGPNPMRDDAVKEAKPEQEHQKSEDIARYTQDQFERLLAADEVPDVIFGLLLLDGTSGARDGELRGLQFKHLEDPRDGRACLNILQQALLTDDDGLHLGPPKWGSKRMIPQHSQAATWLTWWQETGWERYVGREPTDEDFVFPDVEGNMVRPQDSKIVQRWAERAGLPVAFVRSDGTTDAFDMQAIRRTFASMLGELEAEGEVLDALMGHKAKSVRGRHYMGISFDRMQRAIERLHLTLPDRPGVDESSWESSWSEGQGAGTGDDEACQVPMIPAHIAVRRRVASWRGPRSSKPV